MSEITFIDEERELARPLFGRQGQILRKIAKVLGSEGLEEVRRISFDDLIGRGCRRELGKATIRIAWGLSTEDCKRVEGFINGAIYHPGIGSKELKRLGCSSGTRNMETVALRKCLEDAVRNALSRS